MCGGGLGRLGRRVSSPPSPIFLVRRKCKTRGEQASKETSSFYLQLVIRGPELRLRYVCCVVNRALPRGGDALATALTRPSFSLAAPHLHELLARAALSSPVPRFFCIRSSGLHHAAMVDSHASAS